MSSMTSVSVARGLSANKRWLRLSLSVSLTLAAALNIFVSSIILPAHSYQNPAVERGRQRMAHGDYDGAVNALGEALGMNDKDATAYLLRGECFYKLGNFKLAIQDLNNAIQYAPNNTRAYLLRGSCHVSMGEDDSAIADYEGAIKQDPSLGRKFFRNGGDTVGAGNGQNNGQGNAQSDGTAGNGNNSNRRRGRLVTRNGQTVIVEEQETGSGLNLHAIQDYKKAMHLVYPNGFSGGSNDPGVNDGNAPDRDDPQGNSGKGAQASPNDGNSNVNGNGNGNGTGNGNGSGNGRRRGRRRQNQDNIVVGGAVGGNLDPRQTDAQNNAGIEQDTSIPSKNNRHVRNLDQDPNRSVFGVVPGAGEFNGDAKSAVVDFNEVIRNNPNDPATYYQRAKALQKLGRVDDALKDYNQAIQRDPQKSQYYVGRASVFYQLNKPLLAEEELNKARAVDPDVPGVVHFDLPKYPSSVKWSGGDGPGGH